MNPQLNTKLCYLRLSGMVEALLVRLQQARATPLDHGEFFELLVQDELARRSDRLLARRLKQAAIERVKEFADFGWAFNPKLPRAARCEMATARSVADHRDLLLIGPPGVGKSHAATAIAVGAIRSGYRPCIRSVFDFAQDFAQADATEERREIVHHLTTVDLLVLEDFAMKTLGPHQLGERAREQRHRGGRGADRDALIRPGLSFLPSAMRVVMSLRTRFTGKGLSGEKWSEPFVRP